VHCIYHDALAQSSNEAKKKVRSLRIGRRWCRRKVVTRGRPRNAIRVVEEIVGVQVAVAKEFETLPWNSLVPSLGGYIDDGAEKPRTPRLHLRLHLELGDRVTETSATLLPD